MALKKAHWTSLKNKRSRHKKLAIKKATTTK